MPDPQGRADRKVRNETASRSFHERSFASPRRSEQVDELATVPTLSRLKEHVTAAKHIRHCRGELHVLISFTTQRHVAGTCATLVSLSPRFAFTGQQIEGVLVNLLECEFDASFTRETLDDCGVRWFRYSRPAEPLVDRGGTDVEPSRKAVDAVGCPDEALEFGSAQRERLMVAHSASPPQLGRGKLPTAHTLEQLIERRKSIRFVKLPVLPSVWHPACPEKAGPESVPAPPSP